MFSHPASAFSFFFSLFMMSFSLHAQIEWEKTYGGAGEEYLTSMNGTSDGGMIAVGSSDSVDGDVSGNKGGTDLWVTKLDSNGAIEWEKNFGGSDDEEASWAEETPSGNFLIAGNTYSSDGDVSDPKGNEDHWVLKLDSSGGLMWEQCLGGSGMDELLGARAKAGGGVVTIGRVNSNDGDVGANKGKTDLWVVELDSSGSLVWDQNYGGGGYEGGYSVLTTDQGGYVIAGYADSADGDVTANKGSNDVWVLELDASGNILWEANYGGSNSDGAVSIIRGPGSGYFVGGWTFSPDGDLSSNYGARDFWVQRIDSTGILEWAEHYGGAANELVFDLELTRNDKLIAVGYSASDSIDLSGNKGNDDDWVVQLDTNGVLEQEAHFGGTNYEWAYAVEEKGDGDLLVASRTNSTDGDIGDPLGNADHWIMELDGVPTGLNPSSREKDRLRVYPNPFERRLKLEFAKLHRRIRVAIYDPRGKQVWSEEDRASSSLSLDVDLEPGFYLLRVRSEEGSFSKKLIRR